MDVDVVEVASGVFQARAKHVGWVLVTDGDEVTLVDTGYPGDRERVITSLHKIGRSPADVAAVVLTHAHVDHMGSAEHFRSVHHKPVLVHELEVASATGVRVEQVPITTLLKMAWRTDVLAHFLSAWRPGVRRPSIWARSTPLPIRPWTSRVTWCRCTPRGTARCTCPIAGC